MESLSRGIWDMENDINIRQNAALYTIVISWKYASCIFNRTQCVY